MVTVVLVGTLDTKGKEYEYVRNLIAAEGCHVITMDVGVMDIPQIQADIPREQVAEAAGTELQALIEKKDRGFAIERMSQGAAALVRKLHSEGKLHGILALGGSGGSSIATYAMRSLPIGVPKLMVSTIASGDTSAYVGQSDITMMYPIVDIAGINSISERILTNAAASITGMARAADGLRNNPGRGKPLVAVTMFGVTTPCVTHARARLEQLGYEVVVFHANGSGGRAMEGLMRDGFFSGVLDLTTTELADELVGGLLSAGKHRLETAGEQGIPQVVSLGAMDMVNFGPLDTIPAKFKGRTLYKHNPNVTLMRTSKRECEQLGRIVGEKLNQAKGPVTVFVPLKGVSSIALQNEVFYDPEADRALFESLTNSLKPHIRLIAMDTDINDPHFAEAAADRMHALINRLGC
ncbi:Tm-1-like ATP-binding domain-containing protein [uncultured Paenibacillus sp.]|uniref:Tm-1-like ATP-binding domain-containing protein n=1 Tax=uncultured Paenibacillus sp. TaxID=227322 RepID=UPI0028D8FFDD|nr:Tm-1-like ATP-binding domain-containing protein [uncultured Paenibacillus sp.]